MHGFLAAKELDIECLGEFYDMGSCKQYNNLLNKFPGDNIFFEDNQHISFLNGYVHNKSDYIHEDYRDWPAAFTNALYQDTEGSLKKLRGGFCGYLFDKQNEMLIAYTDQIAVKALYYYADGEKWMLSDHLDYMVKVLKANHIPFDFNPVAAQYMLTYAYMIDDSTFIRQIHRLLPGKYLSVKSGQVSITRYHFIANKEKRMSEAEAVEIIDTAFREAIRREFDKDREYGYRHLVDLSGGLDSRMVSWVAHDMGYTDQVNVTYCQAGYRDESISKQVALYLGHEYVFKPLDDIRWMYDLEEITSRNNGAALYMGITGGNRMLRTLRTEQFGIEHTGLIGGSDVGTFYHDRKFNYGKPVFGMNAYSERLKYEFDEEILKEYPCQEMFAIYTRGMLGAESSYLTRQHYVETASPFMDVDFLDIIFSVPFDYRNYHHIYLKWMKEKYPASTEFGWEKWGGVKPKESLIFIRKMKTTQRLLWQFFCSVFHIDNRDIMNPVDYWYYKDKSIQKYLTEFYDNVIKNQALEDDLRKDISLMFHEGEVWEKSMALTVLAMVKKYFT